MSIPQTPVTKEAYVFVIDPALHTCELSCFNELMQRAASIKFQYFAPGLFGAKALLQTSVSPTAIVVLGSGASVYDSLPWQKEMNSWLHSQMLKGIPTLGICYGHQLLAHLFGGQIGIGFGGEKKKGRRKITLNPNSRLTENRTSGTVIVSHKEVVTDSGELEVVGSSDVVHAEVIAHPTLPVWGFQAHIEATPDFLDNNSIPTDASEHQFDFAQRILDHFIQSACTNQSR
jgi:GMP synthase (glutamine-hydrolysing)